MTLALVFLLITLGTALTQSIPDPKSVTLQWLRLGDLIALPLLAVAVVILLQNPGLHSPPQASALFATLMLFLGFIIHITFVQLGKRTSQRITMITLSTLVAAFFLFGPLFHFTHLAFPAGVAFNTTTDTAYETIARSNVILIGLSQILSAFLLGGSIMTMMLGHAYLTAGGKMTQQPFRRLTLTLLIAIPVRALLAVAFGAIPWCMQYSNHEIESSPSLWTIMLLAGRFAVGFVVPVIMAWMAYQCVRIRSNQSATGILYVVGLLLLIGELIAITLWSETGLAF